jgi:uncharacterized protein (UPF0297 family)
MSLVLLATLATVIGALSITAFATDTNSTSTATTTTTTSQPQSAGNAQFGPGMMTDMQGFGGGPGGHGGPGGGFTGGMANIEVSSEYTSNVNAILNNDTDVQSLISQGYNVTAINPIVKYVIAGDGTVTMKATTAEVLLQNGTSGYAVANVDVANTKVTQLIVFTQTVIDKSSS